MNQGLLAFASWPRRIRAALKAAVAASGQTLPVGLHISATGGTIGTIHFWHDILATENMSNRDVATGFDGTDATMPDVIKVGLRHIAKMNRKLARIDALTVAGHNLKEPPFHTLEAHPLLAHAFSAVKQGKAGMDGQFYIQDGRLAAKPAVLTGPVINGFLTWVIGTRRASLTIDIKLTATIINSLPGMALENLVRLPRCGNAVTDACVDRLIIHRVRIFGDQTIINFENTQVLEVEPTPAHEDGRWKHMLPIPTEQ